MNILDLILLLIVFLSVYNGWQKGFILGVTDLLVLVLGLLFTFFTYPYLAELVQQYWPSLGIWITPLSFLITLIIGRLLLLTLVSFLLRRLPAKAHSHKVNHVLGLLPGAVNGFIWITILSALLLALPFSNRLSEQAHNSAFATRLAGEIEWANDQFSPVFDEAVNKTMNRLTVEPGSEKFIELPFKVKRPKVREDLESEMLTLVNEERLKEGLNPVKADTALQRVARLHSVDMLARGYFSHVTPEGKNPFDRIRKGEIRFLTAGENLALGQTLSICHRGLMNSPGHRANILNLAFGRLGIGILDGGIYGLMITQNFRN